MSTAVLIGVGLAIHFRVKRHLRQEKHEHQVAPENATEDSWEERKRFRVNFPYCRAEEQANGENSIPDSFDCRRAVGQPAAASRHCDLRQCRHCGLCAPGLAVALHACSADAGEFRRPAGWPDARQQTRFRCRRSVPGLGRDGLARVQPCWSGRDRPVTRTDGRIPVGLSRCRLYRGLDCRARCLPELHPKPGCRNCGRSAAVCQRDCMAGCLDPQLAQRGNLRAVSLPLR